MLCWTPVACSSYALWLMGGSCAAGMKDPPEDGWRPTSRACPECKRDFHGAECRKSGLDVVCVH